MERTKARFDRWSKDYDRNLLIKLFRPDPLALVNELSIKSDSNILDVGCGTGTLILALADKCPEGRLRGVDVSDGMIDVARRKAGGLSNTKFEVGEASSLPYEDESFDFVVTTTAFHHFPDKARALKEIKRVLRKEGLLYLLEGTRHGLFDRFFEILGWGKHHIKPDEIKRLVEDAGFKDTYQKRLNRSAPLSESILTIGIKH